jgi:hypothetical protein
MSTAFLLRFQESCLTSESAVAHEPTTKTATKTYTRSEQNDVDAVGDHSTSIPRPNLRAEMKTQSRIHKEETGLDRRAASVTAFSDTPIAFPVSQVGTNTKKPREQADRFFESNWQSVPIADARVVAAAHMATAIRSAADDRDP